MANDVSTVAWPVRTARLSIRPATAGDLDATWAFRRLPEVGEWLTRVPTDRNSYAEQFLDPGRLVRTLVVERDGEVIGDLMFALSDAWSQVEVAEQARGVQAELGWVIAPEHAGQGCATEAAAELLRIAFEELGVHRAFAPCFAGNAASWKLMERLGMRREVHARQDFLHRSGVWLDSYSYAILADEWRARGTESA